MKVRKNGKGGGGGGAVVSKKVHVSIPINPGILRRRVKREVPNLAPMKNGMYPFQRDGHTGPLE